MAFELTGLLAATFTPMKANGDVDYDKIEQYCEFLSKEGIKQIYVNGTTGEGPSLTVEERMKLAECWVKGGKKNGRLSKVVIQVGGTCLKDSITMAKHAESIGADAVSTLPPLYFTVATPQDLVDHVRTVAAAAPNTPMYYYHIPFRSGVNIDMEQLLVLGRDQIPSLRGIKFTDKNLVSMSACLRTKDAQGRNFNIVFGSDEQMMGAMAMGADGAIGSTYNWMSGTFRRLLNKLNKGDLKGALLEQHRSQDVVKQIFKFAEKTNGIGSTLKVVMSLVGLDLGPVRQPMRELKPEDKEAYFNILKDMGFMDWRKD